MDYRKSTQWGKTIFFLDPSKENRIMYDFVIREDEEFFGDTFYFHMDITECGDFWKPAQKKLDQMRINSFKREHISKLKSAIKYFPHVTKRNFLTVEYIYGEETSTIQGGRRVIVPGGNYLRASKIGGLNDFHDFSNTLYRGVLYAFNIKRRDDYDYEEIIQLDFDLFKILYFIPVEI